MSWFLEEKEPVRIALEECLCPGTPHAGGDWVDLRPELDYAGGLLVIGSMTGDDVEGMISRLSKAYLQAGVVAWSFVDEAGKAIPVTRQNVNRLRWNSAAMTIANAAADLYGEAVLDPLVRTASESSPSGQSEDSTSPTIPSGE